MATAVIPSEGRSARRLRSTRARAALGAFATVAMVAVAFPRSPVNAQGYGDVDAPALLSAERLYDLTDLPPSAIATGAAYAIETAQRINFTCSGTVNGLWWYRTADDTGPSTVTLWRNDVKIAEGTGSPSAAGWVYLPFVAPAGVSAGEQLLAGVHHPNGAYAYGLNGFTARSVRRPSGCMTAPASTPAAPNGLYAYTAVAALPGLSYADSEYFVSPDFTLGPGPTTTTSPSTTTTIPPDGERIYGNVTPHSSIALGAAYAIETAQRINFTCAGTISGLWWYRIATDTGTATVSAWRNGILIAHGSGAPGATGWVYVPFASPSNVSIGDQVTVGVHHPTGAYAYALNGFNGRTVASASRCMDSPASTAAAHNGLYAYSSTPVLPALSYSDTEYFISPALEVDLGIPTTTTTIIPNPPGGERIYSNGFAPPSALAIGPKYQIQTAQRVDMSCDGAFRGIWWYRTPSDTGTNTVTLWRGGTIVAQSNGAPVGGPATGAGGWVYVAFGAPVEVSAGEQLVVGVHRPNGAYGYTLHGLTNRSVVSPSRCMTVPADRATARNGLYAYTNNPTTFPNLSYAGSEYWISPEFEATIR